MPRVWATGGPVMQISRVGVIGAGVIGRGVAQDLAQTGHDVIVVDLETSVLDAAQSEIASAVRLHHLVASDGVKQDRVEVMSRLTFTTDYEALDDIDFVVENTTESFEVKRGVYEILDRVCPPRARFAANTSAIPITRIAAVTDRPGYVVGMHFMNPVPLKPVVEVIRGFHTSDETLQTTRQLLEQMNKRGVYVEDSPGFVSNRVLMLTVNEAIFTVQDGVAEPSQVDEIFKECFGHEMGPLETADLIGLDTILRSVEVLHDEYGDSKYRPAPLLKQMVDAGRLGRKSGQGFYAYGTHVSKGGSR